MLFFIFQIKKLKEALKITQQSLSGFFQKDQIEALSHNVKVSNKWTDETVKTALRIRCACGIRGYVLGYKFCM